MRFFVALMMLVSGFSTRAIADDPSTPKGTIETLFNAMWQGDGNAIAALVRDGALLERVSATGEVRSSPFTNWINWVDQQGEGDADEQIFSVVAQEFNTLATVWAPFTIHYKGELVGCGVNQFTLVKEAEGWRITHGIDTQHGGDCTKFQAEYEAGRN